MQATRRETVVGVFHNRADAQRAVGELRDSGFREDQIGIAGRDEQGDVARRDEAGGSKAGEGAMAGAAAGAGIGGLWAVGIAAGLLPAIGPVIAGGILASILASAAGAAAVGGLVGALIGMGIPEEEARYYEGEFHAGRTIVTVRDAERADDAWAILHRHGAYGADGRFAGQRPVAHERAAAGSRSAVQGRTPSGM